MVPGRRKEQRDVSGNRIYNKYNISELQVQIEFGLCITAAVNFRARSDMSTGDGWWNPCLGSRWAGLSYFWYISLLFYASSTELYHFLESGMRTNFQIQLLWMISSFKSNYFLLSACPLSLKSTIIKTVSRPLVTRVSGESSRSSVISRKLKSKSPLTTFPAGLPESALSCCLLKKCWRRWWGWTGPGWKGSRTQMQIFSSSMIKNPSC